MKNEVEIPEQFKILYLWVTKIPVNSKGTFQIRTVKSPQNDGILGENWRIKQEGLEENDCCPFDLFVLEQTFYSFV